MILHILLVGFPPFYGEHEPTLFENIKAANFSFDDPAWEVVSDEAKDLVSKLLVADPRTRMSAVEALEHPWCCSQRPQSSLQNVGPNVKKNMLTERLKSVAKSIVSKIRRISIPSQGDSPIAGSALNSRRNSVDAKSQQSGWLPEGESEASSLAGSYSMGVNPARLADNLRSRISWTGRASETDPHYPGPPQWVARIKRRASPGGAPPIPPKAPSLFNVPSRRRSAEIPRAAQNSTTDQRVLPERRQSGIVTRPGKEDLPPAWCSESRR